MTTLVMVPGWEQTLGDWEHMKTPFSDYKVVIIELPGFGKTPLVDENWSIPEYADYVLNKIQELGKQDIVLLGHSFGGRIASYIASSQPPWLKGLVLYGSPSIYRPSLKVKALTKIAKIAKKLGFSKKLSRNAELLEADAKGMGKIYRNAILSDQTLLLPKITVPTLLLWGNQDIEASPELAKEMHLLIPNSTLEIIENAGHNLHIFNQYIFYGKIKNFLQTL
ncbi:alpha/beta fold hydrolase [bacterium]|nr:alpha/beta fold hydrolase [bacterium]